MIKNGKFAELSAKIVNALLNTQILKIILQNTKVNITIRIIKKSLMET